MVKSYDNWYFQSILDIKVWNFWFGIVGIVVEQLSLKMW